MLQFCLDASCEVRNLSAKLFDRESLVTRLREIGHEVWAKELREICAQRFSTSYHGTLKQWIAAWHGLPPGGGSAVYAGSARVAIDAAGVEVAEEELRQTLMQFHPWRKGPFRFFGLDVDTEWRSDMKWDRITDNLSFQGKAVLDVGCGNSYYGWRMLDAGAEWVLGCDPFLLYVMQFEVARKYDTEFRNRHFVLPITDSELPDNLSAFDIVSSMGVLYHRPSPIDHLQKLMSALRPDGQLLLETLVLESTESNALTPSDRYAKMRNVWFIPSISLLKTWLQRTGFRSVEVVDVSRTTAAEQRRTPWMMFESLSDFLDPSDATLTIEGYPAPVRAMLVANR